MKDTLGHEEASVQLLKNSVGGGLFGNPINLQLAGLISDKQNYLYRKVRLFVRPACRDTLCPGVDTNRL